MRNPLNTPLLRRSLLKVGAFSAVLVAIPTWTTQLMAQASNEASLKAASPKPNGLISFNAGWMIPIEDQKALLALEERKNKEAQAAAPSAPQVQDASIEIAKPAKKTWAEKLQDSWKQVKNFF